MKILMAFILALGVGMWIERVTTPKVSSPIEAIKARNIVREFYKIRDAANIFAYTRNFDTTDVSVSTTKKSSGMKVTGTNAAAVLTSSQLDDVTFVPAMGTSKTKIKITIKGLDKITDSEKVVKTAIDDNSDFTITDTSTSDGKLVVEWSI